MFEDIPEPTLTQQLEAEQILKSLPPGGGQFAIPGVQIHTAYVNAISKVFRNPDQAYRMNREDARHMRNSLAIMEPLRSRQMATAHLSWHIEGEDAHDEEQQKYAMKLTKIIEDIPDFLQFKMWLLESIWYGRSAVQVKYKWQWTPEGARRMVVDAWEPVMGDSLVYRWQDGRMGVKVLPFYYGQGTKDFNQENTIVTDESRAYILTDWERKLFIVNKHGIEASDFYEPDAAGSVHGLGLRHYCFYPWRLMSETLALMHEYVERVGLGVSLWRFPEGNQQYEAALRKAAETQSFENVILIPALPDAKIKEFERVEPSSVGIDTLMKVVADYYGNMIRRFILGQGAVQIHRGGQQEGGGGQAENQQDAYRRIVLFDSTTLAQTLSRDLVDVLAEYNFPECQTKFKFKFNVDRQEPEAYLRAARQFYDMGGDIDADSLRSVLGLEKPTADSEVLRRAMTGMEADALKAPGSVADGANKEGGAEGKGKNSDNPAYKVDMIRQAINALGGTAKASDVSSYLESQGITASRSLVYNELKKIRGATQ